MTFTDLLKVLAEKEPENCEIYVTHRRSFDFSEYEHVDTIAFSHSEFGPFDLNRVDFHFILIHIIRLLERDPATRLWILRQVDDNWYSASVDRGETYKTGPSMWHALLYAYLSKKYPDFDESMDLEQFL